VSGVSPSCHVGKARANSRGPSCAAKRTRLQTPTSPPPSACGGSQPPGGAPGDPSPSEGRVATMSSVPTHRGVIHLRRGACGHLVARLVVLAVIVTVADQAQAGRLAASPRDIRALCLCPQVWQRNQRGQRQQALPGRQLLATDTGSPKAWCDARSRGGVKHSARGRSMRTHRRDPLPVTRRRTGDSGTPGSTGRCQRGAATKDAASFMPPHAPRHTSAPQRARLRAPASGAAPCVVEQTPASARAT
jgi:hypothetical protein